MTETAVAELGIKRLVHIEERITGAEGEGLRARWEFGHELLVARDGKGKLPVGYLAQVADQTGAKPREVQRRIKFAERYPDEDGLRHAMTQYRSWYALVNEGLSERAKSSEVDLEPQPAPEGTFSTIVADPPWRYGNTSTRGAAEDHYPTMSIEELCDLDIARERAAEKAHLYLWTTAGHLPDAFKVMEAWGFEYKTYLVWVKPQMGMGNYFRVSTELVLFGVRGGMRTNDKGLMNWFEQPRSKHSAKPEFFHSLVEKASPGPYLELFSRCQSDTVLDGQCRCSKCRLGWETWGNES